MSDETTEVDITAHAALNGHVPVTRLCALDRLFAAQGVVEVKAGAHTIALPIQAVDNELVEQLNGAKPAPPTRSELRNGRTHVIVNETNPAYIKALEDYQRDFGYVYTLCALSIDVVDTRDQVVWSADNSVHDLQAAKDVLRRMGLVDNQRATILNAALNLTRIVEEGQASD